MFHQKYLIYKAKYINLKKEMDMRGGGDKKIDIMLFKADWCGHCKHFKPTWEKISTSNKYNNKFNFIMFDADTQSDKFTEYKVDAFPTILIKDGNIVKPYEEDRSFEVLSEFLNNLQSI
jgi:thiol-disulfide isomerase/thioredoxin